MPDHPARRLSGLLSMDSRRRLPRPWVCGSLELTACARRSSSSTWFSRREGPSAHFAPTFPMGHAFCLARLVVCFFFSLSSLRPDVRSQEHTSLFCLLASISLRIAWETESFCSTQDKRHRIAQGILAIPQIGGNAERLPSHFASGIIGCRRRPCLPPALPWV